MKKIQGKMTFIDEVLGSTCNNPDVVREHKGKDLDPATLAEELAAIPVDVDAAVKKARTVFGRNADGKPILWDYQIRGFIKEALGALLELDDCPFKDMKVGKTKLSKFTHKRFVDNYIFVTPRQIVLDGEFGEDCVRPLRIEDPRTGSRVCLALSETIQAGATCEFSVEVLSDSLVDVVRACLDYGKYKGMLQWRNAGKGRFLWEEIK